MFDALKERFQFAWRHTLHKLPRSVIERYQRNRLNLLVAYAKAHVALYKDLYANTCSNLRTLSDVALLSITNKSMYIGRPVAETLDASRPKPTQWVTTSGSSGEPFTVHRGEYPTHPYYEEFYTLRFLHLNGLRVEQYPSVRIAQIQIHETSRHNSLYQSVATYLGDPEKSIAAIKAFTPDVLTSYASILIDIADHESKKPVGKRLRVRYVSAFGEMLTDDARAHIAEVLECEVYASYGLEEIGSIGCECRMHDGYHVNVETVYAEIIRNDGTPAKDGESGQVILTSLLNTRMPFIRYESGDRGSMQKAKCACGLSTPRIWIEGRYSAYLTFSGRRIHHLEFDGALDMYMNEIRKYQVVKRSDTECAVRIVKGTQYTDETRVKVIAAIQMLVGVPVHVSLEETSHIPLAASGKSKIVLDESR